MGDRSRAFAGVAALLLLAGALEIHGPQDLHFGAASAVEPQAVSGEAPAWQTEAAQERSPCHACLHRLHSKGFFGRPLVPTVGLADQGSKMPGEGPAARQLMLPGHLSRGPPLHFASLA